jgi:hypothetical protein
LRGAEATPLQTTFKAYEAVAQRGRGGVFKAIDLSSGTPRLCILKEGRKHGEVDWDGRDGAWRVLHEGHVLQALNRAGLSVPRFYSSFQVEENSYIVIELIHGTSLKRLASPPAPPSLHSTGFAIRDRDCISRGEDSPGRMGLARLQAGQHYDHPWWNDESHRLRGCLSD